MNSLIPVLFSRPRPHHKQQRAALGHVLLRQKLLCQLLPVAGDLRHVAVFGAWVFGLDGEGRVGFKVQHGAVHEGTAEGVLARIGGGGVGVAHQRLRVMNEAFGFSDGGFWGRG